MNKPRTLQSSINRWVLLTSVGIIAAATSYGIFELCNQQSLDSNPLANLPLLIDKEGEEIIKDDEDSTVLDEQVDEEKVEESRAMDAESIEVSEVSSDAPAKQIPQTDGDKYSIDQKYLSSRRSWSIAVKYKDYVVLSPAGSSVWEEKAKKLMNLADKSPNKRVWTGWYGYWGNSQINAASAHKLCSLALSYSEWRTFFSTWSYSYFNFLWEACGREDRTKPNGWWQR